MPDPHATPDCAAIFNFDPGNRVTTPYYTENVNGRVEKVGRKYVYVSWSDGWGVWAGRYLPSELRHA